MVAKGFHDALGYSEYTRFKPHSHGNDAAVCMSWLSLSLGLLPKQLRLGGVQNLAQGAHEPLINSDDEITMLILEVPLQNLLAYLIIQSGDANIRRGVLPGFWSPPAACCGALWWQQVQQV